MSDQPAADADLTIAATQPGPSWNAFAVTRTRPGEPPAGAAIRDAIGGGWIVELAGTGAHDWEAIARALFADDTHLKRLELHGHDLAGGLCLAILDGRALAAALIVRHAPLDAPARAWLAARLGTPLDPAELFRLFSARPGGAMKPRGDTVCFCCDVRRNEIADAVAAGSSTLEAVGIATRAGTNCRRCRPDIARLIAAGAAA